MGLYLENFYDMNPLFQHMHPTHIQYSALVEAEEEVVYDYLKNAAKNPDTAELEVTANKAKILCGRPSRPADNVDTILWDAMVTVEAIKEFNSAPVSFRVKAEFNDLWTPRATTGIEYHRYALHEYLAINNARIWPVSELEIDNEPYLEPANKKIAVLPRMAIGRTFEGGTLFTQSPGFTDKVRLIQTEL